MKKVRLLFAIALVSLTAGACSINPTAPECEEPESCHVEPGPNT